jgi:hypothetical protein
VRIVYLDQNKWVELARAAKYPTKFSEVHSLLTAVIDAVCEGRLALPLTSTILYETHKINNPERREIIARLQAALSGGLVFRGRHKRLQAEISDVARSASGFAPIPRDPFWFLSEIFFESVAEYSDPRMPTISDRVLSYIRSRPAGCLYDYLVNTPESVRTFAVRQFSEGSNQLRQRIEHRRTRHAQESLAMRRRIYSALLMLDEIHLILAFARSAGVPWTDVSDIGSSNARRIINDVPIYYIERELAVRLEDQKRSVNENDFRDMQGFCAAFVYADHVIGENQFVNLAMQAGLGKKYRTLVSTDLLSLGESLAAH